MNSFPPNSSDDLCFLFCLFCLEFSSNGKRTYLQAEIVLKLVAFWWINAQNQRLYIVYTRILVFSGVQKSLKSHNTKTVSEDEVEFFSFFLHSIFAAKIQKLANTVRSLTAQYLSLLASTCYYIKIMSIKNAELGTRQFRRDNVTIYSRH